MSEQVSSQAVSQADWPMPPFAFAAGNGLDDLCREIVTKLRGRSEGLRAAVLPLLEMQQTLLTDSLTLELKPDEIASALMRVQDKVLTTLATR